MTGVHLHHKVCISIVHKIYKLFMQHTIIKHVQRVDFQRRMQLTSGNIRSCIKLWNARFSDT